MVKLGTTKSENDGMSASAMAHENRTLYMEC